MISSVALTGNIAGIDWKIKIDSLLADEAIVDSKVMSQIDKNKWVEDIGEYLDFVRYWGYDIQGAVYQEIVKQNTGKKLPFIIAAVTKEEEPNIELIEVDQVYLDDALARVKSNAPHVADVKMGLSEPEKCGICGCCRKNKVLLELCGIPVLIRSLQAFEGLTDGMLVVMRKEDINEARELLDAWGYSNVPITEGGATRQESV